MTDAAPETADKPKSVAGQLDELFAPWNRSDAPGLSVIAVKDGKPIYRRGFGMASLESRVAIGPTTKLRIGSTSKHFCALLALLLQEEGKLDLDAPIRTYIPELTGPGGEPSLRLLLQHRGGSRCYLDVGMISRGFALAPEGEALKVQARQTGRNFGPGEAMIYNNGGYHLVSIAIARVGGAPYEEQVKARLFDPLGMQDTISLPSDHIILPGMATLHVPSATGGWRRGLFPSQEVRGEGAIVSTAEDMGKWMAHLRTRDRFGSKETWRQLTEPPVYADGSKGMYALGLMIDSYRGLKTIHHAGGVFGGSSQMLTFPDHGLDINIMANGAAGANPVRLAEQVADIVLADHVGAETAKTETQGHEHLLGRWWSPETGVSYDFIDEAGELKLGLCGMPQGTRLEKDENGVLATPGHSIGPVRVDPAEAANGAVTVSFGGRSATYRKIEQAEAPAADFAAAVEGVYASPESGSTIEILRDGDKLKARFGDPYGRIEVDLHQLGEEVAGTAAMGTDAMHFAVLSFDRAGDGFGGFRLNSMRTRGLAFNRV
jgi:CubicO group peptidase (beta-lactamase class C family)